MRNELMVLDSKELVRQSTDIASLCKEIVVATACNIQGKKYVKVEGWQAIATAHGCMASVKSVEKVDGGFVSIAEIKRMNDGMVLSTAEGFVGDDEKTWGSRNEYAKRAMAQTRAISRACRSAFAHVVVMMNAGLETTPAEEVPQDGFNDRPQRQEKPVTVNVEPKQAAVVDDERPPIRDEDEPRTFSQFVEDEDKKPLTNAAFEEVFVEKVYTNTKNAKGQPFLNGGTKYDAYFTRANNVEQKASTFSDTLGQKLLGCKGGPCFVILEQNDKGYWNVTDVQTVEEHKDDQMPF